MVDKRTQCPIQITPTSPEEVLAVMAQIEQELEQFRGVRKEHDEESVALELRQVELIRLGEQLAAFGRHLQRRKRRLGAVRSGRSPAENLIRTRAPSRSRWLHTVAWVSVTMAGILMGSMVLVDRVFAHSGVATVALRAVDRQGSTVHLSQDGAFLAWHRALPGDPAFVKAVADRLARRGLSPEGGINQVSAILVRDLVVEHSGGGDIALVLAGSDIYRTMATLDVIARAFVGESARQAPRRKEAWRATFAQDASPSKGPMAAAMPAGLDGTFVVRLIGVSVVLWACVVGLAYGIRFALGSARRVQIASENPLLER